MRFRSQRLVRRRGISGVPAGAVAGLDKRTQGGEVEVPLTRESSGTAHDSASCVFVFIKVAADLESQLEMITNVPTGATWFAPDGRLSYTPSPVRAAARDERCGAVEETYAQSADEGQARLSFPVAQARKRQKNSERSAPRGLSPHLQSARVRPNFRTLSSPTWKDLPAGWPPSKSVGRAHSNTVQFRPCDAWDPAASRKTSSPASDEACTLLGAGAGISGIRVLVKPVCAFPSRSDAPSSIQPLGLAEVLAKSASVLKKIRSALSLVEELDARVASTGPEHNEVLHGGTGKGTPKVKSENLSNDDENLQKQIRAAMKQALQVKHQGRRQGRKTQ